MVLNGAVHGRRERKKRNIKEIKTQHAADVLYLSRVLASHIDSTEASTPLKSLLPPGSWIMLRLSTLLAALGDTGSTEGFISTVPSEAMEAKGIVLAWRGGGEGKGWCQGGGERMRGRDGVSVEARG